MRNPSEICQALARLRDGYPESAVRLEPSDVLTNAIELINEQTIEIGALRRKSENLRMFCKGMISGLERCFNGYTPHIPLEQMAKDASDAAVDAVDTAARATIPATGPEGS